MAGLEHALEASRGAGGHPGDRQRREAGQHRPGDGVGRGLRLARRRGRSSPRRAAGQGPPPPARARPGSGPRLPHRDPARRSAGARSSWTSAREPGRRLGIRRSGSATLTVTATSAGAADDAGQRARRRNWSCLQDPLQASRGAGGHARRPAAPPRQASAVPATASAAVCAGAAPRPVQSPPRGAAAPRRRASFARSAAPPTSAATAAGSSIAGGTGRAQGAAAARCGCAPRRSSSTPARWTAPAGRCRLNAWPVDPAFIAGIVDDPLGAARLPQPRAAQPGRRARGGRHRLARDRAAALGKFGDRPPTDFAAGEDGNDRRRDYLAGAAQLLVNDLGLLVAAWAPAPTTTALRRGDGPAQCAGARLQRHDRARRLRDPAAPDRRRPLPRERQLPAVAVQRHLRRRQPRRLRGRARGLLRLGPRRPRRRRRPRARRRGCRRLRPRRQPRSPPSTPPMPASSPRPPAVPSAPRPRRRCAPSPISAASSAGPGTGWECSSSSRGSSPHVSRTSASQPQKQPADQPKPPGRGASLHAKSQRGNTMLMRCLLATTALTLAGAAMAQDIRPVADTVTEAANDLRGVAFAADGKVYVSGHKGDVEAETTTVVGRFDADGSPDNSFGDGGFVAVDLAPGRVEQSLGVVELAGGDVVAAVNALDEDGGTSIYLLRLDNSGAQKPGWGEAGAVEVVFGWANADNDAFPGVETPPSRHRLGSARRRLRRRGEAGRRRLRLRGRRTAAAPTTTASSRGCSPPTAPRTRASTPGRRSATIRRRPSTTADGAPAWSRTARSSAPATPTSATRCATTSSSSGSTRTAPSTRTSAASSSPPPPARPSASPPPLASPSSTRSSATAASPSATPPRSSPTAATSPPATARRPARAWPRATASRPPRRRTW